MSAEPGARSSLWDRAIRLPVARDKDFVVIDPPADGSDLRTVDDHSLRQQLGTAVYAEELQTPRGRRICADIVRLHPNGDAAREHGKPSRNGRAAEAGPAAKDLPSVEDLVVLLARIAEIEHEVGAEMRRVRSARSAL